MISRIVRFFPVQVFPDLHSDIMKGTGTRGTTKAAYSTHQVAVDTEAIGILASSCLSVRLSVLADGALLLLCWVKGAYRIIG